MQTRTHKGRRWDKAGKHSGVLKRLQHPDNPKPRLWLPVWRVPVVPDLTFGGDINLNANIALLLASACLRLPQPEIAAGKRGIARSLREHIPRSGLCFSLT